MKADCPAQTNDDVEFPLTFPAMIPTGAEALLVVMTDDPVANDVNVTIPRCTPSTVTLNPSATAADSVVICNDAMYQGTGSADDYAITISRDAPTDVPFSAVLKAGTPSGTSDDAFLVIPRSQLGTAYWPMGYRAWGGTAHSRWVAVASGAMPLTYTNCSGSPVTTSTIPAGYSFQEKCAYTSTNEEATGFEVTTSSDYPFALISGTTCAQVPFGQTFCDTLMEMMPPTSWAGTDYLVTEFFKKEQPQPPGDIFRILAPGGAAVTVTPATGATASSDPFTDIYACSDPASVINLGTGGFCDLHITGGALIHGDAAIFVGQFMLSEELTESGDPSFTLVTPISHHRCAHRFYSFDDFEYDDVAETNGSYVNVVAKSADIDDILLDGASLQSGTTCLDYTRIDYASGGWSWARCRLEDPATGQHILEQPGNPVPTDERFAAYAYGQRSEGAYAYPTGFGF